MKRCFILNMTCNNASSKWVILVKIFIIRPYSNIMDDLKFYYLKWIFVQMWVRNIIFYVWSLSLVDTLQDVQIFGQVSLWTFLQLEHLLIDRSHIFKVTFLKTIFEYAWEYFIYVFWRQIILHWLVFGSICLVYILTK